jgi:hypothetical protein
MSAAKGREGEGVRLEGRGHLLTRVGLGVAGVAGLVGVGVADGGQVPQCDHDQQGDPGQQHGADGGDGVQPAGEGVAGGGQQPRSGRPRRTRTPSAECAPSVPSAWTGC